MIHVNENDLPSVTARIKHIIDEKCDGNVSKFSRELDLKSSSKISRLFKLDKRSGSYPKPSADILSLISQKYDVTSDWLLHGDTCSRQHINNINIDANTINGSNNITESSNVQTINNEYLEIIKKQQEQIDALMKIMVQKQIVNG